jgi:dihydrofolate reductase
MKAIVAADLDWGIGYRGQLLERIPEDMKLFKSLTYDHVIVMGRKTFESLPGGPLPGRCNVVITGDPLYTVDDPTVIITSLGEPLMKFLKSVHKSRDVFVIGGGEIYNQLLQYCDTIYVTRIQNRYTADTYFKNLDSDREFRLVSASDGIKYKDFYYNFLRYERRQEKKIP